MTKRNKTNQTAPIPLATLLAALSAVLLLILGTANKLRPSEAPWLPLSAMVAALLVIILVGYRRTPPWDPNAQGWQRFIPASLWGLLPWGALLGLLIAGLAAALVTDGTVSQTSLGAYIFPHEVTPLLSGILLGVLFAILVDARLSAGLFFGYGLGFPTALLIVKPLYHDLLWSYGGYIAIFTGLGVLHLLLRPLLDSAKKP